MGRDGWWEYVDFDPLRRVPLWELWPDPPPSFVRIAWARRYRHVSTGTICRVASQEGDFVYAEMPDGNTEVWDVLVFIDQWRLVREDRPPHPESAPNGAAWSAVVRSLDKNICQRCGRRDCKLNAHHIKLKSEHPDKQLLLDNGVTLCLECHDIVHLHPALSGDYIDVEAGALNIRKLYRNNRHAVPDATPRRHRRACAVPECPSLAHALGLCAKHYQKHRHEEKKDVNILTPWQPARIPKQPRECKVGNKVTQDVEGVSGGERAGVAGWRGCSVPGCGERHRARGFCDKHSVKRMREGSTDRKVKDNGDNE